MLAELTLTVVHLTGPKARQQEVIYQVTHCDAVSLDKFKVGGELRVGEVVYQILEIAAGRMA